MMKHLQNTTTLYDIGGMFLVWLFFGLPLGIIFDYFWNLLVLSLALPRLFGGISSNPSIKNISRGRKFTYCFFITLLGVVIDWAYFKLIWDVEFDATLWAPAMSMPLQFVLLIMPMMMLWLVNFALSYSYLRLERRQAIVLGGVMAFFTAPWLLPTMPYVLGWIA